MKDNCSYRFDAILAVALEQDARQELAALPTPAALKELYPDTSSLDARITRALHTLHHPQKALHRALAVVLLAASLLAGTLAVSAEARHAVYTALLRFLPIEMQVTYSVDGTPLDNCRKIIVTIMCRRGLCWMKKIRSVQIFFCSMDTIPPHLPTAIHFPIL